MNTARSVITPGSSRTPASVAADSKTLRRPARLPCLPERPNSADCFVGTDVRDSFEVLDAVNSATDGEQAGVGKVVSGPGSEHDRADPCLDIRRRSGHCECSDCFEVDE